MTFRRMDCAIYLLAVGFAVGSCAIDAPLAHAAKLTRDKPEASASLQGVSVAELERIVAEDKGKPDAKAARDLSGSVLTERMSYAQTEALKMSLPGAKSRSALAALADASVFLPPAIADVMAQAPPDLTEQRRMIALTVDYLGKTLPRLPNFYATESTVRYDASGRRATRAKAGAQEPPAWREIGITKEIVTYRDGKEFFDSGGWIKLPARREAKGLITRGLFGPILSTVIVDAAHGEMTWDRWERVSRETLAVFRYSVPKNQSHYAVAFQGLPNNGGIAEQPTGYHGEVAIDPATGTIVILTVQADLPFGSPILRGDIMVQYGPVDIGGRTYTCPVRSVSISFVVPGLAGGLGPFGAVFPQMPAATLLNDVTFEDYHLFRSQMRILTGDAATRKP